MDAITHLFTHFNFRADLFFIGSLCRLGEFNEPNKCYLHFIRNGKCLLNQINQPPQTIDRPCVVFSPTKTLHSIQPLDDKLEVFCISFDFGSEIKNPLIHSLHKTVTLFLDQNPSLEIIANQIFNESTEQRTGYQAAIQNLCAYFTILIIRCCLEQKLFQAGLLKGLVDKRLASLLLALHKSPEQPWNLEQMAEIALMSKSQFSSYFKEIMGESPLEYLMHWRIAIAQNLLLKGLSVAAVAEKIGYSHNAALTRIFIREVGIAPREWVLKNKKGV